MISPCWPWDEQAERLPDDMRGVKGLPGPRARVGGWGGWGAPSAMPGASLRGCLLDAARPAQAISPDPRGLSLLPCEIGRTGPTQGSLGGLEWHLQCLDQRPVGSEPRGQEARPRGCRRRPRSLLNQVPQGLDSGRRCPGVSGARAWEFRAQDILLDNLLSGPRPGSPYLSPSHPRTKGHGQRGTDCTPR